MAKSRRKNGGPTRGRFKLKKLGKGWVTQRRTRSVPRALRPDEVAAKAAAAATTK